MTIATTPAAASTFAPSRRMAHLRHTLAALIDSRERADAMLAEAAEAVYFGEPGAERRADHWAERSIRHDREIAAVRRAIRAEVGRRYGEVAR